MVPLKRPVKRNTGTPFDHRGRPIIVEMSPPDLLSFRLKGTRKRWTADARWLMLQIITREVAQQLSRKRKGKRKARRGLIRPLVLAALLIFTAAAAAQEPAPAQRFQDGFWQPWNTTPDGRYKPDLFNEQINRALGGERRLAPSRELEIPPDDYRPSPSYTPPPSDFERSSPRERWPECGRYGDLC